MANPPASFGEVFRFYYDVVKPLYSKIQADNVLPSETLFEINAAFDHLSRHWHYAEDEKVVAEKTYSHLKRSCLDIFKLCVVQTMDKYDDLKRIDTSVVDNGEFDARLIALIGDIKQGAAEARAVEGDTRDDDGHIKAFEHWLSVYKKCVSFERDFYRNRKVDWARTRERKRRWRDRWETLAIGVLGGILVTLLVQAVGALVLWLAF